MREKFQGTQPLHRRESVEFYFDITAGQCLVDHFADLGNGPFYTAPASGGQYYYRDLSLRQVLLIAKVGIGSNQDLKTAHLCGAQKLAVPECCPAQLVSRRYLMIF